MRITPLLTRFILFILISAGISYAYLFLPATYQNLDDKLRDFLFLARGVTHASDDVIIVDIDEKSLHALGQWPWERNVVAQMVQNLTDAGAGIIGLDIVFSEADRSSPHRFAQEFHIAQTLPNYDLQFAKTISLTPTILGYIFNFDKSFNSDHSTIPTIPAIFIEKNLPKMNYLLTPNGVLSNLESIQESGYSSGYLNNVPDASGSIRSVPLIMRYEDSIFPSLAFEMFRIANDAKKVTINYSPTGVSTIHAGEIDIPTDRNGRMYLNHRGPAKTFHYLSASDIVKNRFDPKAVEGKYVLVGTSAYGLMDLRNNPFDNIIPGIEIHATVIDNLINQDMLLRPDWIEIAEIGMIVSLSALVILGLSLLPPLWLFGGFTTLFFSVAYLNYYLLFDHHIIVNLFFMVLVLTVSIVSVLSMNYFFENNLKEKVKKKFAQKVSKQVMDDLLGHDNYDALQTREVEATIFFSDIRSFTAISEQLGSPERLVAFLNEYMTVMAEPIVQTHGTIDKFIGDAIMAYWNAPNHVENHADIAVQSALKQLSLRESLSKKFQLQFGINLDFGIGLNTGVVTVGDIGSQGRSDYTVIGDPVNLASRLEGLCKYYHVRLVISEYTYKSLRSPYVVRELDIVRVKGKTEPILIYEVIDNGYPTEMLREELESFTAALTLYREGKFVEAIECFNELDAKSPHLLHSLYIERCTTLAQAGITSFDGVYEFHEK
ncbi:MAG: adenylate/guanylate cyclase domain-containing protein [Sulfuricurvum sp.]|uniref:CHASE2 domain-containing protein n=1 Tax=Sulfuricurvum sp. TaxID=2025608 RepID=UPI0025FFE0AD|nr:adenylate/guanylate cyclase domain-containing protein [Sulfuricurvum sp.]MBV5321767.1 adenylate/guanylate cyclase domain-containing protein [Sulfuricurvum sp.]